MSFDDEQLADEKSISNMRLKYAGIENLGKVKILQNENLPDLLELGKTINISDKLLGFLIESLSGEPKEFVSELKRLNQVELDELKANFPSLEDLTKINPSFVTRPRSIYLLNRKLAQNELKILSDLFELYSNETRQDVKLILSRIIKRRIESLGIMFLNPFCVR